MFDESFLMNGSRRWRLNRFISIAFIWYAWYWWISIIYNVCFVVWWQNRKKNRWSKHTKTRAPFGIITWMHAQYVQDALDLMEWLESMKNVIKTIRLDETELSLYRHRREFSQFLAPHWRQCCYFRSIALFRTRRLAVWLLIYWRWAYPWIRAFSYTDTNHNHRQSRPFRFGEYSNLALAIVHAFI